MKFQVQKWKKKSREETFVVPETKETDKAIEAMKKAGWKLVSKDYFKDQKGNIDL